MEKWERLAAEIWVEVFDRISEILHQQDSGVNSLRSCNMLEIWEQRMLVSVKYFSRKM